MLDLGTVRPGTTLYIPFNTFDSNDPSASVTITGLATTDIEIYKDGSTTQRASDAGYSLLDTDGIDFDTTTGIHGISINLADNTTAGFYASGSQYWVVIASITVDAATINFIAATFRIGYPDAVLNTTIATLSSQTSFTLTSGPAEDDALNGCVVCIHDVASAVQLGFGVVSDYTGSTKTVTLTAGVSFTAAASDNIAIYPPVNTRWFGAVAQAGDGSNLTETGGDGAQLTEAGGTGDHLTAIDLPDQTMNITGNITGNLSGSVGSVTGNVGGIAGTITTLDALDTAQDTQHGVTQAAVTTLINGLVVAGGTIGATGNTTTTLHLTGQPFGNDELNDLLLVIIDESATETHVRWIEDWVLATELATVATLPFTPEDSTDTYTILSVRRDALRLSATGLDAVTAWTVDITGDVTGNLSGSVGSVTGAVGSVTGAVGSVTGNVGGNVTGAVGSVTGNVGGNVVGSVASVTAGVSLANGAITDASLAGNMEIVFETDFATNYNTTRNAWVTNTQDFVGTAAADPFNGQVVAASVTGAVGSVTGAVGSVTGAVGSVAGNVDGNVTGSVGSLGAQAKLDVNAEADTAISDAALATAANLATVDTVVDNLNLGIIYGSAATGTLSTTQATSNLTGYADDQLIGRVIIFTSGNADGEATDITDYANTGGLITFTALTTAPANGDTFKIV